MGRMFEILRQEKKFKMVWFGLSEIFKMEPFKLYIPSKVTELDIAKLNLKISTGNRAK